MKIDLFIFKRFNNEMVQVGAAIPLVLQLFDGSTDRVVKANLFNPDGSLYLDDIILESSGLGMYQNNETLMPDVEYLACTYIVYEPGGVTPDENYENASDTFEKYNSNNSGGVIIGVVQDTAASDTILGVVQNNSQIFGVVED